MACQPQSAVAVWAARTGFGHHVPSLYGIRFIYMAHLTGRGGYISQETGELLLIEQFECKPQPLLQSPMDGNSINW